jgi:hypothetical protein
VGDLLRRARSELSVVSETDGPDLGAHIWEELLARVRVIDAPSAMDRFEKNVATGTLGGMEAVTRAIRSAADICRSSASRLDRLDPLD